MKPKQIEAKAIALDSNVAVLSIPGRKFPALLIPGDSFSILCDLAATAEKDLAEGSPAEARETIAELRELIEGYLLLYENALSKEKIELPYLRKAR